MDHLDPPRPCLVSVGGEWWPGELRAWEQRADGWWGWCHVHVWSWVESPIRGLVYARRVAAATRRRRGRH